MALLAFSITKSASSNDVVCIATGIANFLKLLFRVSWMVLFCFVNSTRDTFCINFINCFYLLSLSSLPDLQLSPVSSESKLFCAAELRKPQTRQSHIASCRKAPNSQWVANLCSSKTYSRIDWFIPCVYWQKQTRSLQALAWIINTFCRFGKFFFFLQVLLVL